MTTDDNYLMETKKATVLTAMEGKVKDTEIRDVSVGTGVSEEGQNGEQAGEMEDKAERQQP